MKTYGEAITAARSAAKIAIDRSIKTTGGETDMDLAVYDRLPPKAFDILASKFGADSVVGYIKAMEAKRMKKGRT